MKTCPYCGTNIKRVDHQYYYCDFCSMKLDATIVKENRERLDIRFREFALDAHIDKTTPEMMTLCTFELLCLLKTIRKERTDTYHHLYVFRRAGEDGSIDFKEAEMESGQDYMFLTKKAFIVENIIRSRLGFVPERITDSFLIRYLENIKKDKKSGPMIIRVKRKQEFKKS